MDWLPGMGYRPGTSFSDCRSCRGSLFCVTREEFKAAVAALCGERFEMFLARRRIDLEFQFPERKPRLALQLVIPKPTGSADDGLKASEGPG